jgi:hypothetical protein
MLTKTLRFFDFTVVEFILNEGEERKFEAKSDLKRTDVGMVSLYLDGSFDVFRDGKLLTTRNPGDFSGVKPDIPTGSYTLRAQSTPTSCVCIGADTPFEAQRFTLSAGEGFGLANRYRLYLARGSASVGEIRFKQRQMISGPTFVIADTDLVGVMVWRK